MPLTKGISGSAGTSSSGSPAITSVPTRLTPGVRPAPSGPGGPAGGPVPPPSGPGPSKPKLWLQQQQAKARAAMSAHKADAVKKTRLIWFGVMAVLMLVATILLSAFVRPRLAGASFRLPQMVSQITPPAGWPVLGGVWGVIIGIVFGAWGAYLIRKGKNRFSKAAGVMLLVAGVLALLQSVGVFAYAGVWLAFVGFILVAAGLALMGRKADRPAWMSFGVLLIMFGLVGFILPAASILDTLSISLVLWLAALWVIVKFAWQIGQIRAERKTGAAPAAPPAGTAAPEKKGVPSRFVMGVALATLLVSLPVSAAAGHLGTPSLNHPGAVTKLDKVCGNGDAQACANDEVEQTNKYVGLLQKIETLCGQDVNKDKPQCSNLSTDRKAYDNPDPGDKEQPGIKQLTCEEFKRLDVGERCADLPKLPKSQ